MECIYKDLPEYPVSIENICFFDSCKYQSYSSQAQKSFKEDRINDTRELKKLYSTANANAMILKDTQLYTFLFPR